MVFSGGKLPILISNTFTDCSWEFDGPAARALAFLSALYASGGGDVVENLFSMIKDGTIIGNGKNG